MESDWSVSPLDGHDDVTLVTVALRNPAPVDRRVRVSNCLDGPVLPPRRAGVPVPGWDDGGFGGIVPAEGRRAVGYACPAPPRRPPVSVTDEGRADGESADSATTAVRELGDPRPPSDALPTPEPAASPAATVPTASATTETTSPPPAVASWLAAVEARIERGERLTDPSVESVTAALDADDVDVADLASRTAADAAALRTVAARVATLEERAAAVDVPVDALRRLP